MDTMSPNTLWLRSEHKANEARTPITPHTAKALLAAGYSVVVERSPARAYPDHVYKYAGCELVDEFSWRRAPIDTIVIGLKELSAELGPFTHKHLHFAHVYKNQEGWQAFLQQFNAGGGTLYDLEYLVDEQGRRVAAFGYWAGYVGAAVALLQWAAQQSGKTLGALSPWESREQLQQQVISALNKVSTEAPTAMVIGANGRSGGGAVELCERCGLRTTRWDQPETAGGGPFDEILQHDVMINCVFLMDPIAPFTTTEHLQSTARRLSVISDVSCDPFSAANPLPIYSDCTHMLEPSMRIVDNVGELPLDLISIDHLPSLLPIESSDEFATALLPHLLEIKQLDRGVWARAATVFDQKRALARN